MKLSNGMHEAEAKPAAGGGAALVQTVEPLEDFFVLVLGNSRPIVNDARDHPIASPIQRQFDGRAMRTVPDGIFHQIGEHLGQEFRIAVDPCGS